LHQIFAALSLYFLDLRLRLHEDNKSAPAKKAQRVEDYLQSLMLSKIHHYAEHSAHLCPEFFFPFRSLKSKSS
jgi:hypothetical protein